MDVAGDYLNVATGSGHIQDLHTEVNDEINVRPNLLKKMVGVAGFEPTALSPPD